ncbi:hypothetical protein [Janthinobacterium sp. MDT1-19]|uniref:hypothetical protein n=1 Tax=Janthinobacterium sp. MDT1-19 TaxID=1259339 RepID=UPI003F295AA2
MKLRYDAVYSFGHRPGRHRAQRSIASCSTALASWSTALPDFVNVGAARRGRSGATSAPRAAPPCRWTLPHASMRRARLQLMDVSAAPTWCALSRTGQLASIMDLFCECRPGRARGHRPGHHRAQRLIASCNTPQLPAPTALASWSTALPDFVNAAAAR